MAIAWTQALSLNIPEIDGQHREFFSHMASLHKAIVAGKGKSQVKKMLVFLEDYISLHFRLEEIQVLLAQWLAHHIDRVDKRMGIWLSANMAKEEN